MTLNVLIPGLSAKSSSVKDLIISILAEEGSLSAKKLHNLVEKHSKKPVSYQAIHKTIKELEDSKIIERLADGYKLSSAWVESIKAFVANFEKSSLVKKDRFSQEGSITMSFDNLYKFFSAMLTLYESDALMEEGQNFGCGVVKHLWWTFSLSKEDFDKFAATGKDHESYMVSAGNTLVDQWLKDLYLKAGFDKIALGVDYEFENDFVVAGDSITTVYFPEELKKTMHEIYSNTKDMKELINSDFFQELFKKKTLIKTVTYKNKFAAEQLRKKIYQLLEEEK